MAFELFKITLWLQEMVIKYNIIMANCLFELISFLLTYMFTNIYKIIEQSHFFLCSDKTFCIISWNIIFFFVIVFLYFYKTNIIFFPFNVFWSSIMKWNILRRYLLLNIPWTYFITSMVKLLLNTSSGIIIYRYIMKSRKKIFFFSN